MISRLFAVLQLIGAAALDISHLDTFIASEGDTFTILQYDTLNGRANIVVVFEPSPSSISVSSGSCFYAAND